MSIVIPLSLRVPPKGLNSLTVVGELALHVFRCFDRVQDLQFMPCHVDIAKCKILPCKCVKWNPQEWRSEMGLYRHSLPVLQKGVCDVYVTRRSAFGVRPGLFNDDCYILTYADIYFSTFK